ncbi:efflux RND transporter periplasmic adaptor subunit [Labrys wisconsinensis]|uniref:RND family efflux transporter MFP subunit n=1 Tax=Labrys wisconsinensis TaxID=425677 RepID=A0ABU0JCJ7_9HYPH|nr:efflux RND transporter periplasmic adaptor subunit [Labrys wisconsinensis]MDQ0472009.1 RND family efflux transporter MFP subunit [Labrys wisconsinensis]
MSDPDERVPNGRPSRVTSVLVGVAVLAILAGTVAAAVMAQGQPPPAAAAPSAPTPVETALAERRDVPHLVEVVGTVQPLQSVMLRTRVDGVLTQVLFEEGDHVQAGQLIATIDDRAYRAALAAAEAQLSRDRAQLRLAELDLERSRTLLERKVAAQQAVDQRLAELDQAKALVALDEANVEAARTNLSFTQIQSPIAGRAGIRLIDPGNLARQGDAAGIVSVTQLDPISVVFPVPQQLLDGLRDQARQPGGTMADVVDRATGAVLARGPITAFDNQLDSATGTARVRAVLANADERLTPGAFVSVRVRAGASPAAVTVPKVAVRPGLEGSFVYRVRDGAAERVPVRLGYADDETAVVAEGLAPGDEIVIDGHSRLRQGARVAATARPAPAAAETAALPGAPRS